MLFSDFLFTQSHTRGKGTVSFLWNKKCTAIIYVTSHFSFKVQNYITLENVQKTNIKMNICMPLGIIYMLHLEANCDSSFFKNP